MHIIILFLLSFFASFNAVAANNVVSIGQAAKELMEPVSILSNFVSTGSLIVGVMLVFSAFMRYMQYRINPLASPISTVFILLILGIVLIALPFVYLLTGAGIPFWNHK